MRKRWEFLRKKSLYKDLKNLSHFFLECFCLLTLIRLDSIEKIRGQIEAFRKELENPDSFRKIYIFSFHFAKEDGDRKNIDLESAEQLLALLLPDSPQTERIRAFLRVQKHYKVPPFFSTFSLPRTWFGGLTN